MKRTHGRNGLRCARAAWLVVLGCAIASTGCATAIGYFIGSHQDEGAWRPLEPPWAQSLAGCDGKGIRLVTLEGRRVSGVLDSVWVDGTQVAIIPYEQLHGSRLPGVEPRPQVVRVDEIESIKVGPKVMRHASWGALIGFSIDVTAVLLTLRALFGWAEAQ